jgi:hypothetical protein
MRKLRDAIPIDHKKHEVVSVTTIPVSESIEEQRPPVLIPVSASGRAPVETSVYGTREPNNMLVDVELKLPIRRVKSWRALHRAGMMLLALRGCPHA